MSQWKKFVISGVPILNAVDNVFSLLRAVNGNKQKYFCTYYFFY